MRFFRRLGGAVRGVIAGGIALATRRRRSAPPPSGLTPPVSRPPRAPRRPRAAALRPPVRPGWLARFGLAGRLLVPSPRPSFLDSDDSPFTPETHPGFSPEVCDFLNTPVGECDPNELYLALAVLAQCLAESLPPELGMDAKALFSTLWSRLGPPQDEAWPDAPADAAPTAPEQAEPDAPPPSPPIQPQDPEPADGTPATAALRTTPARVPPPASTFRGSRSPLDFRSSFHRRRRSPVGRGRSRVRRRPPGGQQALPPRRLYYAACAGPP